MLEISLITDRQNVNKNPGLDGWYSVLSENTHSQKVYFGSLPSVCFSHDDKFCLQLGIIIGNEVKWVFPGMTLENFKIM